MEFTYINKPEELLPWTTDSISLKDFVVAFNRVRKEGAFFVYKERELKVVKRTGNILLVSGITNYSNNILHWLSTTTNFNAVFSRYVLNGIMYNNSMLSRGYVLYVNAVEFEILFPSRLLESSITLMSFMTFVTTRGEISDFVSLDMEDLLEFMNQSEIMCPSGETLGGYNVIYVGDSERVQDLNLFLDGDVLIEASGDESCCTYSSSLWDITNHLRTRKYVLLRKDTYEMSHMYRNELCQSCDFSCAKECQLNATIDMLKSI